MQGLDERREALMWRGDEKEPETRGGEKIRRSVKNVVVLSHDKIWIGAKVASYAPQLFGALCA
jgi:hypothetical protein